MTNHDESEPELEITNLYFNFQSHNITSESLIASLLPEATSGKDDVVNGDKHELDHVSDDSHDGESDRAGRCDLYKL